MSLVPAIFTFWCRRRDWAPKFTNPLESELNRRSDYQLAPIQLALVEIRAGRLRALGVTTKKRSSLLPEVPTIAEAGVSGFDWPIWYGVWVPAGTPAGVVDKLAKGHRAHFGNAGYARLACEAWGRPDDHDAA